MAKYKVSFVFLLVSVLYSVLWNISFVYSASHFPPAISKRSDRPETNELHSRCSFPVEIEGKLFMLLPLDNPDMHMFPTTFADVKPRLSWFKCNNRNSLSGKYKWEWATHKAGHGLLEISGLAAKSATIESILFSTISVASNAQVLVLVSSKLDEREMRMQCYVDKAYAKVYFKITTVAKRVARSYSLLRKLTFGKLSAPEQNDEREIEIMCILPESFKTCYSNHQVGVKYAEFQGSTQNRDAQISDDVRNTAGQGLNLMFKPSDILPEYYVIRKNDHFDSGILEFGHQIEKSVKLGLTVTSSMISLGYCAETPQNVREAIDARKEEQAHADRLNEAANRFIADLHMPPSFCPPVGHKQSSEHDEPTPKVSVDGELVRPLYDFPIRCGYQKLIIPLSQKSKIHLYTSYHDGSSAFLLYKLNCKVPQNIAEKITQRTCASDDILGPFETFVDHFLYENIPFTFFIDPNGDAYILVSNDDKLEQTDLLVTCKTTIDMLTLDITKQTNSDSATKHSGKLICAFNPIINGRFKPSCKPVNVEPWAKKATVKLSEKQPCGPNCIPSYSIYDYDLSDLSVTNVLDRNCVCGRV